MPLKIYVQYALKMWIVLGKLVDKYRLECYIEYR